MDTSGSISKFPTTDKNKLMDVLSELCTALAIWQRRNLLMVVTGGTAGKIPCDPENISPIDCNAKRNTCKTVDL